MNQLNVSDKIQDLNQWVLRAFKGNVSDDRLNNARKSGEALCKSVILKHHGIDYGAQVIGEKTLADLIRHVTDQTEKNPPIAQRTERLQVASCLEVLRTHANPASHDRDNASATGWPDHAKLVLTALADLVNWFYCSFLHEPLPTDLVPYVREYVGVLSEIPTYEDPRGHDIVKLYYPKQQLTVHNETISKDKVSYEFVSVQIAQDNIIGFLFLKKNITIRNTLHNFAQYLPQQLINLTICSPRAVSKETGREIDRARSIGEAFTELKSNKLPAKPDIYYTDEFVWNFCLAQYADALNTSVDGTRCFVDQELHRIEGGKSKRLEKDSLVFTRSLIDSLETMTPINLVVGPAGVGKSTFCQKLVYMINTEYKDKRKRALLITSTDLRDAETDSHVDSVADLYHLYARVKHVEASDVLEGNNLEINISCGNIVLIIDGLDEIESTLKDKFDLEGFLNSAIALNESYQHCAIFITFRDYYLDRYSERPSVAIFSLRGFGLESVDAYLKKRFGNPEYVRKARNLLKGIDFTDDSYLVPLYLSLVCDIVERDNLTDNVGLREISESVFFRQQIPMDLLIHNLIRREIANQSLGISCDGYFEMLVEVAIKHNGAITQYDLNEYVAVCFPTIVPTSEDERKKYRQIYVGPLFVNDSKSNRFSIKYSFVETWIKARYIAYCFREEKDDMDLRSLLAELHYGTSELLDELVKIKGDEAPDLMKYSQRLLEKLIHDCKNPRSSKDVPACRKAISGLLYLVLADTNGSTKERNTERLVLLYGSRRFEYLSVYGEFYPIDFTSCKVWHGWFERFGHFRRCTFPNTGTVFYYSNFKDVDPGLFRATNPALFDSTCALNDELRRLIGHGQASVSASYNTLRSDLLKVAKVGFRAAGFSWKSKSVYKNVKLGTDVSLQKFLAFLVNRGVLMQESAKQGNDYGYVVAGTYRQSVKNLIENAVVAPELEKVIEAALVEFHGIVNT